MVTVFLQGHIESLIITCNLYYFLPFDTILNQVMASVLKPVRLLLKNNCTASKALPALWSKATGAQYQFRTSSSQYVDYSDTRRVIITGEKLTRV